jgi:predicted AAA+ superfamily ATPase
LLPGSADFGHAFEHFVIQELIAYLGYSDSEDSLSYWRTSNSVEVMPVGYFLKKLWKGEIL